MNTTKERMMRNERRIQMDLAYAASGDVWRWHFVVHPGCPGAHTFSAIAPSESGAFRVLNAEHPGALATFDERTHVPVINRAGAREVAYHALQKRGIVDVTPLDDPGSTLRGAGEF
jgi:hypothetical protein